jgi:ABC-2 type transport system ATP-binding protein
VISVEDFHKVYSGVPVVHGISFDVRPGQVLGLVGPNGSGKTTTMKALAGMLLPSRGRVVVAGFDVVAGSVDVKRRVAYLPDSPQLFSDLSIEEHLAFTASAYGVDDYGPRALALLESWELIDHVKKPAGELSRGMRQKAAICCAYLRDADVVMFDEPLTGLDPRGIRLLKQSILERAERGAAIVISSHLLAMVEDVCTHLLLLNAGQQRFFGPLNDIRGALADAEANTLEEIFLLATETAAAATSIGGRRKAESGRRKAEMPPSLNSQL